jgi:hypothetical protein
MLPLVGAPTAIASGMKKYREVFCRDEGFNHVSRYVSGLVLCKNKTLQGIYAQQVWPEGEEVTRRAMHAAIFEARWSSEDLMKGKLSAAAHDFLEQSCAAAESLRISVLLPHKFLCAIITIAAT